MAADALPSPADENGGGAKLSVAFEERDDDEFRPGGAPLKYIPLCDVYSATSPCVTASGSKKVKAAARKPPQMDGLDQSQKPLITSELQFAVVYSRRRKRVERTNFLQGLLLEGLDAELEELEADGRGEGGGIKRRKLGSETESLEVGSHSGKSDDPTSLSDDLDKTNCKNARRRRNVSKIVNNSKMKKRKNGSVETNKKSSGALRTKKWVWYVLVFSSAQINGVSFCCLNFVLWAQVEL